MPKPMTMTIEVEEIAFGRVWRTLDQMQGVITLKMHGTGPKPNKGSPVARASSKKGDTVTCVVLKALAHGKPENKAALIDAVVAAGKAATSFPDSISKLKKAKHITNPSSGVFKITVAGAKYLSTVCNGAPKQESKSNG